MLTEPVRLKVDGDEKVLPFHLALMQLIKSKAVQGDVGSLKLILQLAKQANAIVPAEIIRIEISHEDSLL